MYIYVYAYVLSYAHHVYAYFFMNVTYLNIDISFSSYSTQWFVSFVGTLDPTPHLYDSTFLTLGGLMSTAFIAHALVKPMHQLASSTSKPADEVTKNH